jgi:hypothetical protein
LDGAIADRRCRSGFNPTLVGRNEIPTYKRDRQRPMHECLSNRPQTSRTHGASNARTLRREFAAAMAAVLALEPSAYLDSGCAPSCVTRDLIEFRDGEAAALIAHRIDRCAAFT